MFFSKNVKDKALCLLLVKNMGKDSSGTGTWSNSGHSCQNCGLPKFLFCFTDSYIGHPNQNAEEDINNVMSINF